MLVQQSCSVYCKVQLEFLNFQVCFSSPCTLEVGKIVPETILVIHEQTTWSSQSSFKWQLSFCLNFCLTAHRSNVLELVVMEIAALTDAQDGRSLNLCYICYFSLFSSLLSLRYLIPTTEKLWSTLKNKVCSSADLVAVSNQQDQSSPHMVWLTRKGRKESQYQN